VRLAAALAGLALAACAGTPGIGAADRARLDGESHAAAALLETAAAPAPGELRVRLAFPGGDLDLYVTNAHAETIYFWNTPAQTGGALERDVRCDDPPPRIETVRIPDAPAGRYRVAVDYHRRCEDTARVGFAVALEHGARREHASGEIGPGEWLGQVLEFEIPSH
jgi:uncharacterized protein YfaP (DUF2135 family)